MELYEKNVTIIMNFLKANNYSASVISQHKICYRELKKYLLDNNVHYSLHMAYQWIHSQQHLWTPHKYAGCKYCIKQLDDVYETGEISQRHLGPRKSAYVMLNDYYKNLLDKYISDKNDDRYRVSCARFLLFLQNNELKDISQLSYDLLLKFHKEDFHVSWKSKDVYEDLIRDFLRYLSEKNICDIGLSLALNKLLIHKIIRIPSETLHAYNTHHQTSHEITWDVILEFISELQSKKYGTTVIRSSKHILTLLYIFLKMHNVNFDSEILWYWFEHIKPSLGSNWKQYRRTLCQFFEYLSSRTIITHMTGSPYEKDSLELLPLWLRNPFINYLELLKREGWSTSTIAMHKSSNLRFCRYLLKLNISSFAEITRNTLIDFNRQDHHRTPEGKAAYNCRIRSFLIYLYEQNLINDAFLYKALPSLSATRDTLVQTLSKEEIETIWSINPTTLNPKSLRDYAMVCVGLTMGFRASDITALRFENIDWKTKSIRIVQQKTGKLLTMPMPIKTGNILFRYIRDGRPKSEEPYVFIRHEAPYDRIKPGVCRSALKRFLSIPYNEGCSFHSVRRTFATKLLSGNTRMELISDSLGHSTESTVHKYLALDVVRMRMCALSLTETNLSYTGGAFNA